MRGLLMAITLPLLLVAIHRASSPLSKSTYHSLFLSLADNATSARHLLVLTRRPHVAGSPANAVAASYALDVLTSAGFSTHTVSYDVLLSYPVRLSLTLAASDHAPAAAFDLVQESCPDNPYADAAAEVIPTFHAYAHSGTAAGPVVYANYGRMEDFAALEAMGVNVTGAVVLVRYGKIFRGDIVTNAEVAGAAGAVVYTDAADYGGGGGGPGRWFPHGPGMPPSGVQVGSTYRGLGDPTTPGWPSSGGAYEVAERLTTGEVAARGLIPGIPSLPVSARDGEEIQRTVRGRVAPDDWQAGEGDSTYHLGPGPGFLNLSYDGNETLTAIENVFAVIQGEEEPDRYILLGNHRDAWTFGAVDPNSGTASLLEIFSVVASSKTNEATKKKDGDLGEPLSSVIGMRKKWVEENLDILASRAIAYLNVDVGVHGSGFYASSTPQLDELLKQASKQVPDPDNSSQTIYDLWTASRGSPLIGRLGGGGSDYATFVQHVGIPSVGITFGKGYSVYHSLYDDFLWMKKFGDPLFHKHAAVASIWGLVALKLADEVILPFDYVSYAAELEQSTKDLEEEVLGKPIKFAPLYNAIDKLKEAASQINIQKKELESKAITLRRAPDPLRIREINDRLMMAERAFTDRDGLSRREYYKHMHQEFKIVLRIYGPSKHNEYGSKSFPGIRNAIENAKSLSTQKSWHSVQHELWRAVRAVTRASLVLHGKLT